MQSKILTGVIGVSHGFGTMAEPIPENFKNAWDARPMMKQVHGVKIFQAIAPKESGGEADGVWTSKNDIPIVIATADCVPILLAQKNGKLVAALHAGWRGTLGQIIQNFGSILTKNNENPKDWVAAIGPSIGPCCYEVSPELFLEFKNKFNGIGFQKQNYLDLQNINAHELKKIGVKEVDILRFCTRCSGQFFSYRKGNQGKRQYSCIMKTPCLKV